MYFIAHEGYALLGAEIVSIIVYFIINNILKKDGSWSQWGWKNFSVLSLVIGAIGPDIIDKTLSYPITGHSRYVGHSLPFDILISTIVVLIFRKKPKVFLAFVFGWQMHLILDVRGFMPWFYPFVSYAFPPKTKTFFASFLDPYIYINEIFGLIALMIVVFLYFNRKMLSFKYLI